jgi:hypothetical protein
VVRFDEGGKLDKNFGPVLINEETGKSLPWLKAITTRKEDGMIVAVGSANPGGFYNGLGLIVVLNPEGSFNRVFNGGKPLYSKLLATGEHWHGCAFGGDGDSKIIVTGSGGSSYVTEHSVSITARYLLTCEPDKTFNGQGWTVFHESERQESSLDMAIMADGRIVVSGFFWKKTGVSFPPYTIDGGWVLRYLV